MFGGIHGVMVTIIGDRHGNSSSTTGREFCISHNANPIYPTPPARAGYDSRSIFLSRV